MLGGLARASSFGTQQILTPRSARSLSMKVTELIVERPKFSNMEVVESELPDKPAEGHATLKLERFALTANNVTYAVGGDKLGYWQFFPATPGHGKIPVWGIANVVAENGSGLSVGERVYGYFPMSSHLDVQPGRLSTYSFQDSVTHRAPLPPIYNIYNRLDAEPGYTPSFDDERVLFNPLFATAFLLNDLLVEEHLDGVGQVILGSASSKTAIGLAFLLSRLPGERPRVVGLTSEGNKAFVDNLPYYDETVTYDDIEQMSTDGRSVMVDMSGNTKAITRLLDHFGDSMAYACSVGASNWQDYSGDITIGGRCPFFFAPTRAEKRRNEWGAAAFSARIAEQLALFSLDSREWVTVKHGELASDGPTMYSDVLEGNVRPHEAYVVTVN